MSKVAIPPDQWASVLAMLPPFPIVLATTRTNAITIGQVQYFTFSPLRIGVAVAHNRYTYSLLKEECEFVLNVPDASLVEAVKTCGRISGRDGDKFAAAGLTVEPSQAVQAVGIAERVRHMCRSVRSVDLQLRVWLVSFRKRATYSAERSRAMGGHGPLHCPCKHPSRIDSETSRGRIGSISSPLEEPHE